MKLDEESVKAGYQMRQIEEMFEARRYVTPAYTCKVSNLSSDEREKLSRGNIQLKPKESEIGDLRDDVEFLKDQIILLQRRVFLLEKQLG